MIISLLSAALFLQTIDARTSHACMTNIEKLRPLVLESYAILLQSMPLFELQQLATEPLKRPQTKDLKSFSATIPVFDRLIDLILRESRENLNSEALIFSLRELVRLEISERNKKAEVHQSSLESNQVLASDIAIQAGSAAYPFLLVSPDGSKIYSQWAGFAFAAWDTQTGNFAKNNYGAPLIFIGDRESPTAATQSPDGKIIFSGKSNTSVHLWNSETGFPIKNNSGEPRILVAPSSYGGISALAIHPTEKILYGGTFKGHLIIWNYEKSMMRVYHPHTRKICALAVDPDGSTVHSRSEGGITKHFDAKTANEIPEFEYRSPGHRLSIYPKLIGAEGHVALTLNFKTQYFFGKSYDNLDIDVNLNGSGNPALDELNQPIVLKWHKHKIVALALSPDGQYLYSRDESGAIHFWSLREYLPPKYFEAAQ